jgi:hypothetical protein
VHWCVGCAKIMHIFSIRLVILHQEWFYLPAFPFYVFLFVVMDGVLGRWYLSSVF